MMGDIYSRADSVCVWLGESSASATKAISLLEKARLGQYLGWEISEEIPRLFKLPWFHRLWVLQEVWKARKVTVMCGKDRIPWDSIITMNDWMIKTWGEEPYSILPSIWVKPAAAGNPEVKQEGQAATRRAEQKPCFKLLDLVLRSISMSATDPRDKIYSLLGMCREIQSTDSTPSALCADYAKTIGKTFADFTRWLIAEYDFLFILSLVHASTNRAWKGPLGSSSSMSQPMTLPVDHPSWALWFEGDGKWAKRTLGMSGLYQAAGDTLPMLEPSDELGQCLSLAGMRIGVVQSMHPYPFFRAKQDELHEAYIRLFEPSELLEARDVGNTLDSNTKEKVEHHCRQNYRSHHGGAWYFKYLRRGIWWNSWTDSSFPCHGTPYFKTSEGSFGLCPPGTKLNDIIVILYGGPTPFILRKSQGDSGNLNMTVQYEFIGECFVEGYMHGAAIEEQKRGIIHQEQFFLI